MESPVVVEIETKFQALVLEQKDSSSSKKKKSKKKTPNSAGPKNESNKTPG